MRGRTFEALRSDVATARDGQWSNVEEMAHGCGRFGQPAEQHVEQILIRHATHLYSRELTRVAAAQPYSVNGLNLCTEAAQARPCEANIKLMAVGAGCSGLV